MPVSPLTSDTSPGYISPEGTFIDLEQDVKPPATEVIEILDDEQDVKSPVTPPWRRPQPPAAPPAKRQATVAQKVTAAALTQKMLDDFRIKLRPEARAAFTSLYPRDQRELMAFCLENREDLIKSFSRQLQ